MKKVGQIFRESLVSQVEKGFNENSNVFLLNYSKVSGSQVSELRKDLKKVGASVYAAKNSVARLALQSVDYGDLSKDVKGQMAFVWSSDDSSELSKILVKFAKAFEDVEVQGGVLEGKIISSADVTRLSDLPPREVLLATLMATMQAPLTRLAGALNAKTRDLLSILKQLSEQKGGK